MNTSNSARIKLLFYFIILFSSIVLTLTAVLGIDLTDKGYLLGNPASWREPYFFPIWGSAAAANILLMIFGDWSYLALKLFSQYFFLLFAFLFYRLVLKPSMINSKWVLIILFMLISWVSRSSLSEWLYYSTWSGILISVAILFLHDYSKTSDIKSLNMATGLVFLSIIFKITNVVFLPLIFFAAITVGKASVRDYLSSLKFTFLTWLLFFVTLCFAGIALGIDDYIIHGVKTFREFTDLTTLHSPGYLISRSLQDLKSYIIPSISFVLYLISIGTVIRFSKNVIRIPLVLILSSLFVILQAEWRMFEQNGLFIFYVGALGAILLSSRENRFLAFAALYFLITCSMGSSTGLRAAFIAEPLVCYVLFTYPWVRPNDLAKAVVVYASFSLCLIGLQIKIDYPFRDLKRTKLTTHTSLPTLKGNFTNVRKAQALEEIYELRRSKFPDAKVALIYPSAPLLHYALGLQPYLPSPWVNLYFPLQLERFFKQNADLPDVVIKLKQNPRKFNWPEDLTPIEKDINYPSIEVMESFVILKQFKILEETAHFIIWRKAESN